MYSTLVHCNVNPNLSLGLTFACVLGGDAIEKQFASIHSNPDVIFATPGRFVHICLEMSLKLNSVEYVVFDEADRLFEMGLGDQLREILARLPDTRQTALFSATLPKLLVDFAKAGLTDPTLVRLDVETKIPETLKLAFLKVNTDGKDGVLLHLLKNVIPAGQQTIVFCATRYHVEYLQTLLGLAELSVTAVYSQLDPAARKINTAKFATRKVNVMIVTDLAARGIDIPLLDNVINYHFPGKSKLFVHRVGRVARAGRQGTAFSLIAPDEMAYYVDLQLFLGGESVVLPVHYQGDDWHRKLGVVPQTVLDEFSDRLSSWYRDQVDVIHTKEQSANAYKAYLKSRPAASKESVKRSREFKNMKIGVHPALLTEPSNLEIEKCNILDQLKSFKPRSTIFEIGNTSKNKDKIDVMMEKRRKHAGVIEQNVLKMEQKSAQLEEETESKENLESIEKVSEEDIERTFDKIVRESKRKDPRAERKAQKAVGDESNYIPLGERKTKTPRVVRDESNYIPYQPADHHAETGYSLQTGFTAQVNGAVLDLTGDEDSEIRKRKGAVVWDKKSKKYVKVQDDKKRIKTESGVYISATYKTNRYARWKERSKLAQQQETVEEDDQDGGRGTKRPNTRLPDSHPAMKKAKLAVRVGRKNKNEIRRPEQILKTRTEEERKAARKARPGKGKGKGKKKF